MNISNPFFNFLITLIAVSIPISASIDHLNSVLHAREKGLLPRAANPGNTLQKPLDPVRIVPNKYLPTNYRISAPYCSWHGHSSGEIRTVLRCREICICGGKQGNPDQLRCGRKTSSAPSPDTMLCSKFCDCGALAESLRKASSANILNSPRAQREPPREKPQTLKELMKNWPKPDETG